MSTPAPFPALRFDRLCRTAASEAYLLSEDDNPLGRVDIHFGSHVVHAVLLIERDLATEDLQALIDKLDAEIVWTADQPRDDFVVTVYRGTELGIFSDDEEDEEDGGAAE